VTATNALFRAAIVFEIGKTTKTGPCVLRLPHLLYLGILYRRRFSVTVSTVIAVAVATAVAALIGGPSRARSVEAVTMALS